MNLLNFTITITDIITIKITITNTGIIKMTSSKTDYHAYLGDLPKRYGVTSEHNIKKNISYWLTVGVFFIALLWFSVSNSNKSVLLKSPFILHVCPQNSTKDYYQTYRQAHIGDSGVDLVVPYDVVIAPHSFENINYMTQFVLTKNKMIPSYSYYLFARSSLSHQGMIFVGGTGIIDAEFRGNLSSLIYNLKNTSSYIKKGDRLVQICAHDLSKIVVVVNCNVPTYGTRGNKGFGSTNTYLIQKIWVNNTYLI